MVLSLFTCILFLFFLLSVRSAPSVIPYDVSWDSPSPPNDSNYDDGMPLGNGRTVVLGWNNITQGGLDFYVRSPLALHSDSTLFTLARFSVSILPNPFLVSGSYFNQTHHLEDASVTLLGGGTSYNDYLVRLQLFVDANSDAVFVTFTTGPGNPSAVYSFNLTMESVRPSVYYTYQHDYSCNESSSQPDTILSSSLPNNPTDTTIGLYHVNAVINGTDFPFFADSLRRQGLGSLLANFSDPLDGRIFGVGATGAAGIDGSGSRLQRISSTVLASIAPASSFVGLIAAYVDTQAQGDTNKWINDLSLIIANYGTVLLSSDRVQNHLTYWNNFWNRSYIWLPPTPPVTPPIAVGTCTNTPDQLFSLDPDTNVITLPNQQCFTPSSDGTSVYGGTCSSASVWKVTPCTATGCTNGEMWVQNTQTNIVLGLPGATCPYLDVWTVDNPTGQLKNELWYFNTTDNTLRTLCTNCANQCVTVPNSPSNASSIPNVIAAQYARSRFIYAVQSRNVNRPVKFNGMLFTNQVGTNEQYRQWGTDSWFQNDRLPAYTFLAAGDVEEYRVYLDWLIGYVPLALARTNLLLPGEEGIFFTETTNAFGLYQGYEYGCDTSNRPEGYPVWLEGPGDEGGWVRYDHAGNAATLEGSLWMIDYYWYTQNTTAAYNYIQQFAVNAVNFYMTHYPNRTTDGKVMIWPTQVLETYWTEWPGWTNYVMNDLPTIAAIRSVVQNLLLLPESSNLLTPEQRTTFTNFYSILPDLPLLNTSHGLMYTPAEILSSGTHNAEVPELFAAHPYRLLTVGRRTMDPTVDLTIGQTTWYNTPLAQANTGWYYGIMDAAFLGLANESYSMVLNRATQPPPGGYRYPAFAQHYQDYEPSADHYANMNSALQWMLLQSGEDGSTGSIVLFPAWPCTNDVSFKLWGPLLTTVEVVYSNSTLVSLTVDPPARMANVHFANCVSTDAFTRYKVEHGISY